MSVQRTKIKGRNILFNKGEEKVEGEKNRKIGEDFNRHIEIEEEKKKIKPKMKLKIAHNIR